MGFLERLFRGSDEPERQSRTAAPRRAAQRQQTDDERAVERYRYLLKTAPPETVEQAHAEAFAQLTPEQRQMVLQELTQTLPEAERAAATQGGDDPRALARTATRAEMRQPGTMERTFGGASRPGMMGGGIGMGGLLGGSFLSSFAGIMVGSAIANQFFNDSGYDEGSGDGGGSGDSGDGTDSGDGGDVGAEDAGAGDGGDVGGGDLGGGDFGGDFGGGDFGGGDFGGGDF